MTEQLDNRISVSRGTRADSKGFLKLLVDLARFEKLEPPTPAARRRILRDIFERKRLNLLMAYRAERPVGYALYYYAYSSFLARPTLYLEDLFVLEETRGIGVGGSLFHRCMREAVKHGCGRMEWSVLVWNRKAIRFYERLGARELSEWKVYRLDTKLIKKISGER